MKKLEDIVSLCKRRGFIFPGSDVYGGMSGTWDYGPLGVALKRKIMNRWWQYFVEERDDMYGVDAAILMNPRTWVASGHAATFSDPLVECKECHQRFRADKIADVSEKVKSEEFLATHTKCPNCGKENWDEVKQFNMMLCQQGKAFRNEISPRDFVFRSREFEQMEIEYFVAPKDWEGNFNKLLKSCHEFLEKEMALPSEMIHDFEVPPEDRAHYSKRTIDIEFDYPIGREELMGIAYRTDFDLMNIQRESGKSMEYRDKNSGESFVPHVIEPSFGVERLVMAVLTAAYTEDEIDGEKRVLLKLPENLAPFRFCVSPLLKNKPELSKKAKEVYDILRRKYVNVAWDDSGNIGKRYRKQDEIGTPKCVVVDFETLEDDTVTVRDRDTTKQIRTKISDL